jgi:NADH dehydrogenase (ubiquinone) 1 alpha subcomplex subunit 10
MIMIQLRYLQYVDALAHIMNTGQGAVLDRSYFSDRVFTHSMFDEGYISKDGM